MAAFSLRLDLAKEVNRHFLENERRDLSFFSVVLNCSEVTKISVWVLFLWNDLKLTAETKSTSPVRATCDDISVVHSAVICEEKVSPKGSMASEVGVPDVPFTWEH